MLTLKGGSVAVNENALLERVTAAAEEHQLSPKTLTAYRRTSCPKINPSRDRTSFRKRMRRAAQGD
jgi:hypothetical protein